MKWLRSAEMEYTSLIVNEDAAHDCIQKLGDLGVIEFMDLNEELTPFQRRYVSYIKRCDELDRKLRYFDSELAKFNIPVRKSGTISNFISGSTNIRYGDKETAGRALDMLERVLEEKEAELRQLNTIHERLTREYNEKMELEQVIARAPEFFDIDLPEVVSARSSRNSRMASGTNYMSGLSPLIPVPGTAGEEQQLRFSNLTGVVPADERLKFERMIFRSTRGNCYTRFSPIDELVVDPSTGQLVEKHAFVILYQSTFIEAKLRKICDAFHARLYTLPSIDDRSAIANLMQSNRSDLNQSLHILRKNRESCVALCMELSEHVQAWKWTVLQEKATYHTLNLFKSDVSGMLRGEGWVIKSHLEEVKAEVQMAHASSESSGQSMPSLVQPATNHSSLSSPPTHFQTNKFTDAYQAFVDTYGVPRYGEINPAVFTAVTFPFLFGVMYGDIGHGTCVFLFGLYMILTEKKMEQGMSEMLGQMYYGRYMIMMMGAFAMYAGLIYNDFFALSLNLFGSKFVYGPCHDDINYKSTKLCEANYTISPEINIPAFGRNFTELVNEGKHVYPFGLDPIWKTRILQMTFGLCLRGWNAIHFGNWIDFFFEFVPMMMFTCSMFLYMVVLIVMKWCINWQWRISAMVENNGVCPSNISGCEDPPLINTLINIALKPGSVEKPMFANQKEVQTVILLIAGLSVPLLLVVKPFLLKMQAAKLAKNQAPVVEHQVDFEQDDDVPMATVAAHGDHGHGHGEEFDFSEVFIHQAIETIEFVLGMISNTASYLRLWALSLAHSELANVFWEKAMLTTINMDNFIYIFVGFAVFAATTTGVILMMDVLECFLHALRLHWVEFQNKFYKADGYKFVPFSFQRILTEQEHQ